MTLKNSNLTNQLIAAAFLIGLLLGIAIGFIGGATFVVNGIINLAENVRVENVSVNVNINETELVDEMCRIVPEANCTGRI